MFEAFGVRGLAVQGFGFGVSGAVFRVRGFGDFGGSGFWRFVVSGSGF